MKEPRRVVILAFEGVNGVDISGPMEVLAQATQVSPPGYAIEVRAPSPEPVPTTSGLLLTPHGTLADCTGPIDTLIVTGGEGNRQLMQDPAFLHQLRSLAARSRRVASVCTGALVLAAAGLLDGRRATTHWQFCDFLSSRFPRVEVEPDAIFVRDDDVITSAGITAGMDMTLSLVEEDVGREVALTVARSMVMFTRRAGGQSQFSASLSAQLAERDPLRDLQEWMVDHVDEDLSVPALASRACMSPRNFARAFRAETGVTPAVYVRGLRVERARTALEAGELQIQEIALQCGFGTVEAMRRAFRDSLGIGPAAYRARFRSVIQEAAA
jgi:transcriptional regulator GlxA family with amidase domain